MAEYTPRTAALEICEMEYQGRRFYCAYGKRRAEKEPPEEGEI